jgi:hypothetical protein
VAGAAQQNVRRATFMTTGFRSFDEEITKVLLPTLRARGYTQLNVMSQLFVKGRMLLCFEYDFRDKAYVYFGAFDKPINIHFPDAPLDGWREKSFGYEYWLFKLGHDPGPFTGACGGQEREGLQLPDFELICKTVKETLPNVEEYASNN